MKPRDVVSAVDDDKSVVIKLVNLYQRSADQAVRQILGLGIHQSFPLLQLGIGILRRSSSGPDDVLPLRRPSLPVVQTAASMDEVAAQFRLFLATPPPRLAHVLVRQRDELDLTIARWRRIRREDGIQVVAADFVAP